MLAYYFCLLALIFALSITLTLGLPLSYILFCPIESCRSLQHNRSSIYSYCLRPRYRLYSIYLLRWKRPRNMLLDWAFFECNCVDIVLSGCLWLFLQTKLKINYNSCTFLFFLTIEKTTISVFQIHHDLPCIFYYTLFILFLVILKNKITFVTLSFLFLWFAVWTKITTLPWLLLPIIFKIFFPKSIKSLNNLSITKIILIHFSCGVTIFILMGFCIRF